MRILKEYAAQGAIDHRDLYLSINCIDVDCKDIERCKCNTTTDCSTVQAHFEIPQIANDFGDYSISYIGSADREIPFVYYTSHTALKNHKYRKRGKNKPYVWIDSSPNENGMLDCFVYNAPLLSQVSVTAIFKDPRQLEQYNCCTEMQDDNKIFIDAEIVDRVTKKYLTYYRQLYMPPMPNNQSYTPA